MTVNGESFGGTGRIELLARIAAFGSITQAAKSMKMSYKAAWDAINAMSQLAGESLLERMTGGKGGGGTKLTQRGEQLVANFRTIEREHRRFVDELSAQSRGMADDILLLGRMGAVPEVLEHFSPDQPNSDVNSELISLGHLHDISLPVIDNTHTVKEVGGSDVFFVSACPPSDCLHLWERHLPSSWRIEIASPTHIKRYREYEIKAERCVGYDAANQPCFTSYRVDSVDAHSQTSDENCMRRSSEMAAWRLNKNCWLVYQVNSSNTRVPQGNYAFQSEMPR